MALVDKPLGIPEGFAEHSALMFDLLLLAWQTDLTRVFTFMMSREASQRTFSEIGINDPWHVVSHHGDRPEKVANNAKVNVLCLQMFARFLEKLKATPDGDGSLLDHAMLFYGSGMGNSNVHATDPLPMVAVGGRTRPRRASRRAAAADPDRQPVADGCQPHGRAAGQVRREHRHRRVVLRLRRCRRSHA